MFVRHTGSSWGRGGKVVAIIIDKYDYGIGMNVYSFVSRYNRFEILIATFRLQYC